MGEWQSLVTITEPTIGSCTGAPLPVPPPTQFRVVAVDMMGGEAASEVVEGTE